MPPPALPLSPSSVAVGASRPVSSDVFILALFCSCLLEVRTPKHKNGAPKIHSCGTNIHGGSKNMGQDDPDGCQYSNVWFGRRGILFLPSFVTSIGAPIKTPSNHDVLPNYTYQFIHTV
ncbi:hypothetical protein L1887_02858 [Cichorium endivia]|nr:hypothetical protein L1887_02858 [Cichorium endivia]